MIRRVFFAIALASLSLVCAAQRSTPVTVVNSDSNPLPVTVLSAIGTDPAHRISTCIEGISGNETADPYAGCIATSTIGLGVAASDRVSGGAGSDRAVFDDLTITKLPDQATPLLFVAAAKSSAIPKVEIYVWAAGQPMYAFLKIELRDVRVTRFVTSSSDAVSELVAFDYAWIKIGYTPIDESGVPGAAVERGWDVQANEELP